MMFSRRSDRGECGRGWNVVVIDEMGECGRG